MLLVIALEVIFNGLTWWRVSQQRPESNLELFGQIWVDLGALSALLFLSGGTTNPFVSLYLPSLAIAAAVLPWHLMAWLAAVRRGLLRRARLRFRAAESRQSGESVRLLSRRHVGELHGQRRPDCVVRRAHVACSASYVTLRSADAQQRLLHDERAVALGVQAATVAHEIGTPLSTIAMLSEELRDAARTDQGLAPYSADLELLEQQMTLCTSALARLRSRAPNPRPAGNRSDEWLESFVEQWRLRHPHVQVRADRNDGTRCGTVSLDDTVAVRQILTILLDNAARASRDHVTLCVHAHRLAASQMQFDVCDAGPGIPAALRGSLGAMPVDSTQGGHGVGLYLAFSAAARLGGIDRAGRCQRDQAARHACSV